MLIHKFGRSKVRDSKLYAATHHDIRDSKVFHSHSLWVPFWFILLEVHRTVQNGKVEDRDSGPDPSVAKECLAAFCVGMASFLKKAFTYHFGFSFKLVATGNVVDVDVNIDARVTEPCGADVVWAT